MSLFQAREWWYACPDAEEEFDQNNLIVANIDNSKDGADKIVTGSWAGVLRIYFPKNRNFRIEDLLLEQVLDGPILQLLVGRFCPNSTQLALAVLHSRLLVVYSVTSSSADSISLCKVYQHKLQRAAYNMCHGPFGGVKDKDFLCVQSMDGQLSFFEQEAVAFSRYLNNFLLPGPICYMQKTDAFISFNAQMEVESYKYPILSASSADAKDASDTSGLTSSKKVQLSWSVCLGDHLVDMFVARFSRTLAASQVDLLCLGENTLFTLKEQGSIRIQKRLEFNPSCCCVYSSSNEDVGGSNQNLIIGTHQGSLMVYKDTQLVWACRIDHVPVAIAVGSFGGQQGMIVTLSEQGKVQVSYLGTDPPNHGVVSGEIKELDYESMDEEHRQLLKTIKEASTDTLAQPDDHIELSIKLSSALETVPAEFLDDIDVSLCARDYRDNILALSASLTVLYTDKCSEPIHDIQINFSIPNSLINSRNSITIAELRPGDPLHINLSFKISKINFPSSREISAVASYCTSNNEPRTGQCSVVVPLFALCRVVPPIKAAEYKFILDTNRPPPTLLQLFEDIVGQASADIQRTAASGITVMFYGRNVDVSVLVSRRSGRYRFQSSSFEAMWLLTEELAERLNLFYDLVDSKTTEQGDKEPPLQISLSEAMPLNEYFLVIDQHLATRIQLALRNTELERNAHQFRLIQKRLLARFKDKNPAPLKQLDVLMKETFESLMSIGKQAEALQKKLAALDNQLSCATLLTLQLIRFKFGLDNSEMDTLKSTLSPVVYHSNEQGWEETTDSALRPLNTLATASVYFHKFFAVNSFNDFNTREVVVACLFLAAKVEETRVRVCDVINIYHSCIKKSESSLELDSPDFIHLRDKMLEHERKLLDSLEFLFVVKHPYQYVSLIARYLLVPEFDSSADELKKVTEYAYLYIHDSLRTKLCLEYPPQVIAIVCFTLAIKTITPRHAAQWNDRLVQIPSFNVRKDHLLDIVFTLLGLYPDSSAKRRLTSLFRHKPD